ncbi:MAG: lysoplasmalogenase [Defluviitaleaceae bacterium]|nr:lysoplasmalogenase [Defluviitaleaceae bacterium]
MDFVQPTQNTFYDIKFIFVVVCFFVALGSYFLSRDKRSWAWLVGGMAFTVAADFFLVLQNAHVPGVAVFCFTHVCYALRAQRNDGKFTRRFYLFVFTVATVTVAVLLVLDSIFALVGMYAALFMVNLYVNFRYRRTNKNGTFIFVALVLFALCDMAVMLFNVPNYLGVMPALEHVYPFIWIFYLPAQAMLAVSAIHLFQKER